MLKRNEGISRALNQNLETESEINKIIPELPVKLTTVENPKHKIDDVIHNTMKQY